MASPTSSSAIFVTREEFNAFHKIDRVVFTRLILILSRDIGQSLHAMSFLLYLENSGLVKNLIVNLVSLPDFFITAVADEIVMCLSCLSYEDFSMFIVNLRQNINFVVAIPLISRMTGEQLTLALIHQNRTNILHDMKMHLTRVCYPAFEDICAQAEKYNKEKIHTEEREKAMEKLSQLGISSMVHRGESSNQFLSEQQYLNNEAKINTSGVALFYEDAQVMADNRTIFLTFSKGYPISEAEVHAYFTRRYGEIIQAIHMPEVEENEQALYARMVLHSADKIPEIVSDGISRNKFTINGKHVWARKYIPKSSIQ